MMLNLPPRNGYLPIIKIISIQAKHIAAEATTLRTSWTIPGQIILLLTLPFLTKFSMKSIAVSASDKIHSLNQLSSSRKYLRPIAKYSQNCCRYRRLKAIMIIVMFPMFPRPEKDDQKYLNAAQCWVSKVFIGGTSSKESRTAVRLLWDSRELGGCFSEEWGYLLGIYLYYIIHLERERSRPWERDIRAPVLQSDLGIVNVWGWVFSLKYMRPRKVEKRMRKSR